MSESFRLSPEELRRQLGDCSILIQAMVDLMPDQSPEQLSEVCDLAIKNDGQLALLHRYFGDWIQKRRARTS